MTLDRVTAYYKRARTPRALRRGGSSCDGEEPRARPFACPVQPCDFTHRDVETVWAHMWSHPSMNRRQVPR